MRILFHLATLALDMFDLVLDWYSYYEVRKTADVKNEIMYSILSFPIIGTIFFILIIINEFVTFCRGHDYEENNSYAIGLSLLSTIFEDCPQMGLAIIDSLTTKKLELFCLSQIAKAVLGIVQVSLQLLMKYCDICNMRKKHDRETGLIFLKRMEIGLSICLLICSSFLLDILTIYHFIYLHWSNSAIYHPRRMQNRSLLTCYFKFRLWKYPAL